MKPNEIDYVIYLRDVAKLKWKNISEVVGYDDSTCVYQYKLRKAGRKHRDEVIALARTFADGTLSKDEIWEKVISTPGFSKEFLPCTRKTFGNWVCEEGMNYTKSMYNNLPIYREILRVMRTEYVASSVAARKVLGLDPKDKSRKVYQFAEGARNLAKSKTK